MENARGTPRGRPSFWDVLELLVAVRKAYESQHLPTVLVGTINMCRQSAGRSGNTFVSLCAQVARVGLSL
jgi:hypothetical protein